MSATPSQPPSFEPIHSAPPERGPSNWPLAMVALLIVVAAAIGIWAFVGGAAPAASPTPTPAAIVTPSPATAPPDSPVPASPTPPASTPATTPAGTPVIDVREHIDEIVAQVPPLRQLEPLREVPYEFVTREQFQVDLQDLIDEETDPEELAIEESLLKRLGLLPQEIDLREAILELYGSQVAAFYRPDTGTFYIIGEPQELSPFDQLVVAHEYTHALQDQHYDLEGTRISDPSEGDAALAQTAAIEGDASLLMLQWGFAHIPDRLGDIGSDVNPADLELLERMPLILRRQLEFPYNEGLLFSLAVFTAPNGGWEAINETLANPPASTEQILHPAKYLAGEQPVAVTIPDLSAALGGGWQQTYQQTMGELNLQVWVGGGERPRDGLPGMPPTWPHVDVAAGWGGDRLAMYEDGEGGWAITWELAWDTAGDADDFLARAMELQGMLDGVSEVVQVGDDRVRILLAHDTDTLEALSGPLGE